jgi:hypothetical protein
MEGYEEFGGTRTDQHRARLAQGLFQLDQNGDRSINGSWRPRPGRTRLAVPQSAGPVETIYGWELAGLGYVLFTAGGVSALGLATPPDHLFAGDGDGASASGVEGAGT